MTDATTPPVSGAVLEQAARWYAVLRDGRARVRDRQAWQAWLRADAAHQTAWSYVEDISRSFDPLRGRADARLAADALETMSARLHTRRRVLTGAVALAGVTLTGWVSWREALLPAGLVAYAADHRTATGELRELALADGSRVWLNTASAINVRFDAHARSVELLTGEIFIATAADAAARPFLVHTAQGRMQALGTRFNVRREAEQTRLAVYEGAVEIRTAAGRVSRRVPAGQQAHFDTHRIAAGAPAGPARAAWTDGTLIADNLLLRELVDELRRYRPGHLGVADEVAALRVYGHFPARDTDRVLGMLASALPIRIEQRMPWWTTIKAR